MAAPPSEAFLRVLFGMRPSPPPCNAPLQTTLHEALKCSGLYYNSMHYTDLDCSMIHRTVMYYNVMHCDARTALQCNELKGE